MKKPDENNLANWANWALIRAWFERQCQGVSFPDNRRAELSEVIANRFRRCLGDYAEHGPRTFVILTDAGLWGRGETLAEAVRNSKSYSKTHKVTAVLVLNDDSPTVDGWGRVTSSAQSVQINLGLVGTVGSVLNANKS